MRPLAAFRTVSNTMPVAYKSPEKSSNTSRKRQKSPAREALSAKTRSKSKQHTEQKKKSASRTASKEDSKAKDIKYVAVKKEASDEAINLKKILKAEREELPEIRKRGEPTSFLPVVFPAGRIYRPGVLEKTIPVTPTDQMVTEMRERQQRTLNRTKAAPRKYTGVTKATKTTSKTASKSNSNEGKSGGRKIKGDQYEQLDNIVDKGPPPPPPPLGGTTVTGGSKDGTTAPTSSAEGGAGGGVPPASKQTSNNTYEAIGGAGPGAPPGGAPPAAKGGDNTYEAMGPQPSKTPGGPPQTLKNVPPPPARPPPPKKLSTSERKHAVPIRDDDGVDLESEKGKRKGGRSHKKSKEKETDDEEEESDVKLIKGPDKKKDKKKEKKKALLVAGPSPQENKETGKQSGSGGPAPTTTTAAALQPTTPMEAPPPTTTLPQPQPTEPPTTVQPPQPQPTVLPATTPQPPAPTAAATTPAPTTADPAAAATTKEPAAATTKDPAATTKNSLEVDFPTAASPQTSFVHGPFPSLPRLSLSLRGSLPPPMLATPTITVLDGHKGLYNNLSIPMGKVRGFVRNIPGFASVVDEDGDELTLMGSHLLPVNDKRGLIHSETYSPSHPRSFSLMCHQGSSDSEQIQFQYDAEIVVDLKRETPFDTVVIPLYHSHVLWSYMPWLWSPFDDGSYVLTLVSVGPHLSAPEIKNNRIVEPIYVPRGLSAPHIDEGFVEFRNAKGDMEGGPLVHAPGFGGALVLKTFTPDEIDAMTVNGKLRMLFCITVPRSYFDLSSVIDLTVRPTVTEKTAATVAKILRGEKPKGWDFQITGGFRGSGDASVVYYIHSAALESKSPKAKAAAAIPASGDRGARLSLDANGLAAAVQIAYGVEVPLPKTFNRDMDITLQGMFADHYTSVVVPQWEREICRRALALDVRNPSSSSMVELLRLLNAIWESGYIHVAKRVVVGVMADMMHLGPYTSTLDFVQNTVLPSFHESGMNPKNLPTVLASLASHLNTIPGVKKKTVQKGAEHTPTTPHSESTHVVGPDCEIGTGAAGFYMTLNENGDVTITGIYPLKATDGRGVISSDQYKSPHRRSTSLQCTEGEDSKYISFLSTLRVPIYFNKLGKEGACQDFAMMPLYGKYLLALRSVGPHLSESFDEIDDSSDEDSDDSEDSSSGGRPRRPHSGPKNVPPGQSAPPIAGAFLWTTDDNCVTTATFDLVPSVDGSLLVSKPFTLEELRALSYDGKHIHMCWNIIVPRSYFDLSSVIDLTATPTVPASATATVEKILRGEKPHGCDFMITGGFLGSGDASVVYYMHSAALESKSPTAKKSAAAFPGEKARGARLSLDAFGLAAAVQIAYGVEVPLPKTFERNMAITLEGTFGDHFTSVVVPQWEREICRRALALDVRNPTSSSMVELLRLLNAIWEMPYGYFPIAKRVVVGVLADMMHLSPHVTVLDFVQNKVLPSFNESGMNPENLLTVLASLAIYLNTIPIVAKARSTTPENQVRISNRSGAASNTIEKTVQKDAEHTPTTPPSELTHVELEMPPAELLYPEESTDIDLASFPATRSCSIL
ncbi:hypothetical protein PRIPAC_74319 [Pristionchus pacificus]|uniref:Uncharacterized protein n=1 Tax=Pristionchus pacificus TaxID=54126 RepID=A0A2A6B4H8_PRIPA|nr:hypothetical protein PRIPAC_74319 [Pristionchus pacificus]|eukprot:PDM60786.1 hypothetical protein PRIPAC_54592 [Pristionchus pacificus]